MQPPMSGSVPLPILRYVSPNLTSVALCATVAGMTSTETQHQYPGNERWQIHCADPHPCPGCWCAQQSAAVRAELVRMIGPGAADTLLADRNLRIELREE